uniref:Tetratricopeptide repeat-containing protein n=1 Tax=Chromera velia CCMP2878 TaxID=1169474 RepID=A0A0G4HXY3_9ALVE|eukprot:Cvel_9380.t1-p1 / transcript=Cvel_9380.t1 / gene=Cvel_9380 / organism=Chromera_velia_CCMP2878 / gene_product=Tetratricopeptide repeat protein 39C, putative / transcript_product=Tetratricopeptide repeat protein 39C, putative / location=Cvel_scaffold539:1403-8154(+) / protein_length=920 / sequence_SO=supercontig / SO=protein_coding / is_pseudo=false
MRGGGMLSPRAESPSRPPSPAPQQPSPHRGDRSFEDLDLHLSSSSSAPPPQPYSKETQQNVEDEDAAQIDGVPGKSDDSDPSSKTVTVAPLEEDLHKLLFDFRFRSLREALEGPRETGVEGVEGGGTSWRQKKEKRETDPAARWPLKSLLLLETNLWDTLLGEDREEGTEIEGETREGEGTFHSPTAARAEEAKGGKGPRSPSGSPSRSRSPLRNGWRSPSSKEPLSPPSFFPLRRKQSPQETASGCRQKLIRQMEVLREECMRVGGRISEGFCDKERQREREEGRGGERKGTRSPSRSPSGRRRESDRERGEHEDEASLPHGQALCHAVAAETHLWMGLLEASKGAAFAIVQAGVHLRKAFKGFEMLRKAGYGLVMGDDDLKVSCESEAERSVESSALFGSGALRFFASLVPPKFWWFVESLGMAPDRDEGLRELRQCLVLGRFRAPWAGLLLVWVWSQFVDRKVEGTMLIDRLRGQEKRKEKKPLSPLLGVLGGYALRGSGDTERAVEMFEGMREGSSEVRAFRVLSAYEIGWCLYVQGKFAEAAENLQRFLDEHTPKSNKAWCAFQLGVCLLEMGGNHERVEALSKSAYGWKRPHFSYDEWGCRRLCELCRGGFADRESEADPHAQSEKTCPSLIRRIHLLCLRAYSQVRSRKFQAAGETREKALRLINQTRTSCAEDGAESPSRSAGRGMFGFMGGLFGGGGGSEGLRPRREAVEARAYLLFVESKERALVVRDTGKPVEEAIKGAEQLERFVFDSVLPLPLRVDENGEVVTSSLRGTRLRESFVVPAVCVHAASSFLHVAEGVEKEEEKRRSSSLRNGRGDGGETPTSSPKPARASETEDKRPIRQHDSAPLPSVGSLMDRVAFWHRKGKEVSASLHGHFDFQKPINRKLQSLADRLETFGKTGKACLDFGIHFE